MVGPDFEQLLQNLEATLKLAQGEMRTDNRGAAITALRGVIGFVNAVPRFESQSLSIPLTALMAALHDLNLGRVGPIVRPTPGFDNRRPDSSFRKVIRAISTFSIDQLMGHGMPRDHACKFVASCLEKAGVLIGGRRDSPSWKTVSSWRSDVTRRDLNDQEQHTLRALRDECEFAADIPLDVLKKEIAQILERFLAHWDPPLE